jgi:hypothetical protein
VSNVGSNGKNKMNTYVGYLLFFVIGYVIGKYFEQIKEIIDILVKNFKTQKGGQSKNVQKKATRVQEGNNEIAQIKSATNSI